MAKRRAKDRKQQKLILHKILRVIKERPIGIDGIIEITRLNQSNVEQGIKYLREKGFIKSRPNLMDMRKRIYEIIQEV